MRAVDVPIPGTGNLRRHFHLRYDCAAKGAPPFRTKLVRGGAPLDGLGVTRSHACKVHTYMEKWNQQGAITAPLLAGVVAIGSANAAANPLLPGPAKKHGVAGTPAGVYTHLANAGFEPDEVAGANFRWVTMKYRVEVGNLQVRGLRGSASAAAVWHRYLAAPHTRTPLATAGAAKSELGACRADRNDKHGGQRAARRDASHQCQHQGGAGRIPRHAGWRHVVAAAATRQQPRSAASR